ncbi:F-box domain family protein [Acanthocheilonema viteae]
MLDILSDDIIWRVFRYLDVKSRIRFAAVNTTFYGLLNKKLLIAQILKRCPLIRKLAIHNERVMCNTNSSVLDDLVNVDELHMSSNFFTECQYDPLIKSLFSFSKLHLLHIQQRYNEEKCHRNIIREQHVEQLTSTSLSNIKLQGVVITGSVLKLFCLKYRKTLEKLCLLGALVPSQDTFTCFQAINSLDRLICLTLAPSLYSISTTNEAFFKSYPTLKSSKMLKLVAVYVSRPDVSQLKLLLQQILPSDVEQLMLYDESYRSAYQIDDELKEMKCKIQFCRDDNIIIDSYWMNGKSELITHTLWKPPYKTNTFLPAMLPEWYCVLSELMETAVISEYSCSNSSRVNATRNMSQLDEFTCTDHSASYNNEDERALCSLQNKTLQGMFEIALEHFDFMGKMIIHNRMVNDFFQI